MKKLMNDICQCGHYDDVHHVHSTGAYTAAWCSLCSLNLNRPLLHYFKQDNLKYIEQIYEEQNK